MADMYRDSEERYHRDAEFRAAVDMLWHFATKQGYTPGPRMGRPRSS